MACKNLSKIHALIKYPSSSGRTEQYLIVYGHVSTHLVEFVSLGSDVIHQNLVGCQLVLDGSPSVLRLLQPHSAPQFMDHLNPKSGLKTNHILQN